jgi:hypothetical protein
VISALVAGGESHSACVLRAASHCAVRQPATSIGRLPAEPMRMLAWLSLGREVGALYRPDLSLVWLGGGLEPDHDVAFDYFPDRRLAAGDARVHLSDRQEVGGATWGLPKVPYEELQVREGTVGAASPLHDYRE